MTVRDRWRGTSFSSTYSYHHGYFDGPEREFRGFGRVEQVDVEDYGTFADANITSPYITQDKTALPAAGQDRHLVSHRRVSRPRADPAPFQDEYFPSWFEDFSPASTGPGPSMSGHCPSRTSSAPDEDLTADEWREALRACKGMMLRQEVYELDVDALARGSRCRSSCSRRPRTTATSGCVQPQAANRHAVFHVTESEAITLPLRADLAPRQLTPDPRIAHTLNLSIDEYGNIRQSVAGGLSAVAGAAERPALADGREALIAAVQAELHLAYAETRYTDDRCVSRSGQLPLRLPCEVLTYELTGVKPPMPARRATSRSISCVGSSSATATRPAGRRSQAIAYHQLPDRPRRPSRQPAEAAGRA